MNAADKSFSEPFRAAAQQREAAWLGMWLFLATEIMMFGVLFLAIAYYRYLHPAAVAEAVGHLHYLLAGFNSSLLLTGSLSMTLAVQAARVGARRRLQAMLLLSAALGLGFLALKGFEYGWEYREGLLPGFGLASPLKEPAARLYMNLYFFSTALHGVHILIAVGLVAGLSLRIRLGWMKLPERAITVEMIGLYWHLVDVIWIFLYPTLYLLGRSA